MPSILITCIGTRGDVQPFVAIALEFVTQYPQYDVVIAAHAEYEPFIKSCHSKFIFEPISPSVLELLRNTPQGKIMTSSKNPFKLFPALKQFTYLQVYGWFTDIHKMALKHKPVLMIIPTFAFFSNAQFIATEILKIPYLLIHTVPFHKTKFIAPPTAGLGESALFKWINALLWWITPIILEKTYKDPINKTMNMLNLPIKQTTFEQDCQNINVFYIYSNKLLPTPSDWPQNHKVVGNLELPDSPKPLPDALLQFINQHNNIPIIYIGLGSMLSVVFKPDEVEACLNKLANGVFLTIKNGNKLACVLHTVASQSVTPLETKNPNLFILNEPVAHSQLFPKMSMILHHGGMGTTHTGLLAGKPTIILPCGPTSDQPFWQDVVFKRGCGPKGFPISELDPMKLSTCLMDGLNHLDFYSENARAMSKSMQTEQGAKNIVKNMANLLNME
eukprot:NODE_369_length_8668_cov_1.088575.p2 type:complete len:446 gc:universal NODE_369_length_8668_cov_1.088575:5411-4074(-)